MSIDNSKSFEKIATEMAQIFTVTTKEIFPNRSWAVMGGQGHYGLRLVDASGRQTPESEIASPAHRIFMKALKAVGIRSLDDSDSVSPSASSRGFEHIGHSVTRGGMARPQLNVSADLETAKADLAWLKSTGGRDIRTAYKNYSSVSDAQPVVQSTAPESSTLEQVANVQARLLTEITREIFPNRSWAVMGGQGQYGLRLVNASGQQTPESEITSAQNQALVKAVKSLGIRSLDSESPDYSVTGAARGFTHIGRSVTRSDMARPQLNVAADIKSAQADLQWLQGNGRNDLKAAYAYYRANPTHQPVVLPAAQQPTRNAPKFRTGM